MAHFSNIAPMNISDHNVLDLLDPFLCLTSRILATSHCTKKKTLFRVTKHWKNFVGAAQSRTKILVNIHLTSTHPSTASLLELQFYLCSRNIDHHRERVRGWLICFVCSCFWDIKFCGISLQGCLTFINWYKSLLQRLADRLAALLETQCPLGNPISSYDNLALILSQLVYVFQFTTNVKSSLMFWNSTCAEYYLLKSETPFRGENCVSILWVNQEWKVSCLYPFK